VKLNHSRAAKAAGISRKTLYAHVERGKVSQEKDGDNNPIYDLSELIRAYPNLNTETVNTLQDNSVTSTQTETATLHPQVTPETQLLELEIRYLKEKLEVEQERRLKAEESAAQEKAEKVSLLEIVDRHSRALPTPIESELTEQMAKRGFWGRLFGQ
jgi:acetylornithine deacetylase/succinyl-diaminopimelate desuccinylase-like protein